MNMTKRQVSARDVAELAGVSRTAVSRAFTPGASVAKETRARIEAAPLAEGTAEHACAILHRIAEAAGKETVATFIENDETLRKVRTLGIHFGQGFRLAEPQALEQLKPAVVELSTGRIGG